MAGQNVAILSINPGTVSVKFCESLVRMAANYGPTMPRRITEDATVYITKGRNDVVRSFLGTDCLWAWLLDNDIVFQEDTLQRLLTSMHKSNATIMSGVYWIPGREIPLLADMDGNVWGNYPDGIVQTTATGLGCMLVHRSVFEDIRAKADDDYCWFTHPIENNQHVGEDVAFCRNAIAAGHPIFADTTIPIGHHKGRIVYYPEKRLSA